MDKKLPTSLDRDRLLQLSKEQLVDVIVEQVLAIQVLKSTIVELEQEIQRLKVSRDLDSQTSSKPPSGDILKKSEKKDSTEVSSSNQENREGETLKRRPGGQPGHLGKTRKGFGRVDRFEILRPQICSCCNHGSFVAEAYKIETQQVAQLVQSPIEIVEYQRHTCIGDCCGNLQTAEWMKKAGAEAGKLLRSLRDKTDQWWYFLDHPEVPPDNNLAARTIRLAVTKRKVSGGSRSMERFKHTANLLTVVQTCRRQGRSVIEFFEQAIKAMVNPNMQEPSLIPQI